MKASIYKRTLEEYPNTILSEYLKSAKKKHDVKVMSQIIDEYVLKIIFNATTLGIFT